MEELIAARSAARKSIRICCCALALALCFRADRCQLRCFPSWPQPFSIPPALVAPALLATLTTTPGLARTPTPPALPFLAAGVAAITLLRLLGLKPTLTALQNALATPGPATSGLMASTLGRILMLGHGSALTPAWSSLGVELRTLLRDAFPHGSELAPSPATSAVSLSALPTMCIHHAPVPPCAWRVYPAMRHPPRCRPGAFSPRMRHPRHPPRAAWCPWRRQSGALLGRY